MTTLDVAIVGAGPAGLAAATLAAERGLSVSLYDEQRGPGGQVYRGITAAAAGARRHSRRRLLARRGAGAAVRAVRRALRARRDGVGDRAARRRHVRRLGEHGAAGCAHHDDRRRARGDPRDRRAGASVSRRRVDAARRDDGRRRADPAQDRGRCAARAHGARRQRAAVVAARVAIRARRCLRSTRCSTPRRAGASPKRCAHAAAFVLSPYFAKGRRARADRAPAACASSSSCRNSRSKVRAPRPAVRFRAGDREETLLADHVLLHQGVVPDVNLAARRRLRARVERTAGVLRAGGRRVGRFPRTRALRRRRRRGHRRRRSRRRHAAGSRRSPPRTRSAASTGPHATGPRNGRCANSRKRCAAAGSSTCCTGRRMRCASRPA